ncbi:TetR/AcrR family transcriptional regulator [Candidatus Binatia bacterium]|nr:TetR/AcrR family transcriptional regulator [Candidatus Binatia bacterium]
MNVPVGRNPDMSGAPGRAADGSPTAELGKRERNARRNRAAILDAARAVFAEIGYGAATVRDIVRRTDLAAGTFYNYFPDKESVLREIFADFTRRLRAHVHETRMGARNLEDLLRSSFLSCFRLYAEEADLVATITRNAAELQLRTSAPLLEPAIAELIEDLRAKEREGIVPHLDNERIARVAVAMAVELGLDMLSREPVDIHGTAEFATLFMLGGIERIKAGSRSAPA